MPGAPGRRHSMDTWLRKGDAPLFCNELLCKCIAERVAGRSVRRCAFAGCHPMTWDALASVLPPWSGLSTFLGCRAAGVWRLGLTWVWLSSSAAAEGRAPQWVSEEPSLPPSDQPEAKIGFTAFPAGDAGCCPGQALRNILAMPGQASGPGTATQLPVSRLWL